MRLCIVNYLSCLIRSEPSIFALKNNTMIYSSLGSLLLRLMKIYDDLKGGVSGGTVATMLSFIEGDYVPKRFDFDPLMKYPDGSKSTNKVRILNLKLK